jgi:hypothetical protein
MTARGQPQESGPGSLLRSLRTPILVSGALPVVIYLVASPHMPRLAALALAGVPPLVYGGQEWTRRQSLDIISAVALFTIVISLLLAALVRDPHVLLIRDACLTGVFGILCLLSLLAPQPMAYWVYRWAFAPTAEQLAVLETRWKTPRGRFARRLVTTVWGIAFSAEALLDLFLAYHLPTAQFVEIHPFLFWGTLLVVFGWATQYARRSQPAVP